LTVTLPCSCSPVYESDKVEHLNLIPIGCQSSG